MGTTDPRYQTHVKPESIWYYCFLNDGDVYYAYELNITGATSFTQGTLDPVTFYSPGVRLFAVMEENRDQSATGNLVVTVYGWEQSGSSACSGTFTFRPYAPRDEAVECVSNPSRPRLDFPSSRAARSSGSPNTSYVEASTNSPGCRMKG